MTSTIVFITSMITTVGCLAFMIRGLNRPLAMACYAVAMLPLQISCPFISGLKVNELAIIIWLVVFSFYIFRRRKITYSRYATTIFVSVLLVSAFNAFKYFQSGNPDMITELIRLLVAIAFPFTVSLAFFYELQDAFREILLAWNTSASIIAVLSLLLVSLSGYSFVSYVKSYITTKTNVFYIMKFAASPFISDPNSYGGYIVISIGIAYYLYKETGQKKYIICSALEIIGLITTLSRGAILSFIIAICVVLFINRKTKLLGGVSIFIGLTSGVSLLIPYFQNDRSAMSRFEMWGTAISMFKDHPVFGVGLSNYTYYFGNYGSAGVLGYNPYTHNLYLKILVECGIVGELLFLTLCLTLLKLCIKYAQVDGMAMMILFGVLAFLVQGMTVEFFTSNYFWFLLITGLFYMQKVNDAEKRNVIKSSS